MKRYTIIFSAARARRGMPSYCVMLVQSPSFAQGISQHHTREEAEAARRELEAENHTQH